jgi:hypothetical protein
MIPYQDLVAALRHWRERNGLPNVGIDVGPPPQSAASLAPPMGAPLPRAQPIASPPPMQETVDIEEEIDAHEIQSEDVYEGAGDDFSMSFGDAPPQVGDSTALGVAPPPPNPKFPAGGGYTDPGTTDPDRYGAGLDDDFEQEQAAMAAAQRDGTRPGIGIGPADDGGGKKKKKR